MIQVEGRQQVDELMYKVTSLSAFPQVVQYIEDIHVNRRCHPLDLSMLREEQND